MIDSTESGHVVDQRTAGATQLVVEHDAGRKCQKALQDALPDVGEGAGPMAFQGQDVLAGL